MRNGKLRGLLITVMLLVFLAGLASILYPYIWGAAVDSSIASIAKDFLEREEPELPATTVIIDSVKPEKVKPYPELWEDMVRYNQNIAAQGQSGLSCAYDYQKASFQLADYGLPDEIFGVLSIPAIDLKMPIYLGATEQHMANGAAHLSQHIINYAKTCDIYVAYRKAGYSKKFLSEHESEIILHKVAKQFFDEQGLKKLPTVKSLQAEYSQLLSEKKAMYADYQKAREDMRSLQIAKANVDRILGENTLTMERESEKDER